MLIVPAIDLKGGKVVRLIKGDFSQELVYADDPVAMARRWESEGASRLHVVDLDGALTGTPRHLETVAKIVKSIKIPVQTGGGIRTLGMVKQYLEQGVDRVILGTKACLDEAFITKALKTHGDKIATAVDVKGGRVAIEGWVRKEWMAPKPLVQRFVKQGVKTILYTDTSRDGTMGGPAIDAVKEILSVVGEQVTFFLSGGVSSIEDLVKLKELESQGLDGVVVGRALYEGKLDLKSAIAQCSPKESSPVSTSKTAGSSKGSAS